MQAPFDFSKQILLQDERVLLRPLETEDLSHLLGFSVNEPEIWTYSLVNVTGEENLKRYIYDAIEARKNKKEYAFIVFDKQTNEYAGSTRYYDVQLNNLTLQLGYTWYGKKFQGSGLNKHCKFLLLDHAFNRMGMERVEFRADANNEKSIAAMKSIGCTVEGVLRSNSITAVGKRRDSIVLSILKNEWDTQVHQKLKKKLQ